MGTLVHAFSFDILDAGLILKSYAQGQLEVAFPPRIWILHAPFKLDCPQNPHGYSVDTVPYKGIEHLCYESNRSRLTDSVTCVASSS